jgi:hypothetical protein
MRLTWTIFCVALAQRNCLQRAPDPPLECGGFNVERQRW